MKIVIATPLYPPEIAEPAPYVKELAKRLAGNHTVTVVTYANLPEKVEGVRIVNINKNQPLPFRLAGFTIALCQEARKADFVYIQNGAAAELPAVLVSLFVRRPYILGLSDTAAIHSARQNFLLGFIHKLALRHLKKIQTDFPLPRPEILPLEPQPTEALEAYEKSWDTHLGELKKLFHA